MADMTQQLREQITSAAAENRALQFVGGNSKAFMGRDPVGDVLSVADHQGIIDYQPLELVITARAGTLISGIESVLAEKNQVLSFEPPKYTSNSTIGGTLATNQSGPARPYGGSIRDHLLGLQLINGKGELLKFGGQVMKNVAGYDVSRLQAGAMGSLGLITEVSLKVLPKPAMSLTLVEEMSAADAIVLMNERANMAKPITAASWLEGRLYIRLGGAASAVEACVKQWSGEVLENDLVFWSALRDQQLPWFDSSTPLWRFSVKSTAEHFMTEEDWLIDWGGAQRWLKTASSDDTSFDSMVKAAENASGQVSLFRGGDRQAEVFHPTPHGLQLIQQRLKHSFDPQGIFNRGRLYSWL